MRNNRTLGTLENRYMNTRKLAEDDTKVALDKVKKMKEEGGRSPSRRADTIEINPEKPDLVARPTV